MIAFKLLIDVVYPLTNPNKIVDVAFKLVKAVLLLSYIDRVGLVDKLLTCPSIVVDVAFKLLIDAVCPLTNPYIDVDVVFKIIY